MAILAAQSCLVFTALTRTFEQLASEGYENCYICRMKATARPLAFSGMHHPGAERTRFQAPVASSPFDVRYIETP